MNISYINIKGLDSLRESLNPKRIQKDVAIGVGRAALLIHSELRGAIQRQYKAPHDLNTVLIGKANETREFGRNVIKGGLNYRQQSINLAQYMNNIPPFYGNLYQPKPRQGWVHTVEIIRGRKVRSHGKFKMGGFTPRDSKGTLVRKGGKAIMMERTSESKYPIQNLYGPTIAALAMHMYEKDSQVQKAKDKASEVIFNTIMDNL